MNFITLFAISAVVNTGFGSLPAHAEAPLSAVDKAIETIVDSVTTQTTELEDVATEVCNTPNKIDNATVTSVEKNIIPQNTSPVANQNCFGADPAKPFGYPDTTLPRDEDPAGNDVGFPTTPPVDEESTVNDVNLPALQPDDIESMGA
jgi:hypothetical protein